MKNKRYFPLYVDLSDKNIVVVGGGTIATRRVKALLLFTRNITVIAPKMTADLWELGKLGKIQILAFRCRQGRKATTYQRLTHCLSR